jgi:hypothetical protein
MLKICIFTFIQGDSNMTGTDLCVNKPQSVPVIFEPPCITQTLEVPDDTMVETTERLKNSPNLN